MSQDQVRAETVSLLQDLGLKEYEARCFLALSQIPSGTAKQISDLSEVPRTRVYDAVRVLEAQGLVEVQHANPQQFRAVSVDEAVATLRRRYDDRIDTLRSYLESIDWPVDSHDSDQMQEVWSLSGHEAIESRTLELVEAAESEIVLLVVEEDVVTPELIEQLREAADRGVDLAIGGESSAIVSHIESELADVDVFETKLNWLVGPEDDTEVAISRLLLTDRTTLLVSSFYPAEDQEDPREQAVFATGLGNGIVVLIRRLISTGLAPANDPGK